MKEVRHLNLVKIFGIWLLVWCFTVNQVFSFFTLPNVRAGNSQIQGTPNRIKILKERKTTMALHGTNKGKNQESKNFEYLLNLGQKSIILTSLFVISQFQLAKNYIIVNEANAATVFGIDITPKKTSTPVAPGDMELVNYEEPAGLFHADVPKSFYSKRKDENNGILFISGEFSKGIAMR